MGVKEASGKVLGGENEKASAARCPLPPGVPTFLHMLICMTA